MWVVGSPSWENRRVTHVFHIAQAAFESARQLNRLPSGHRSSRLHGHGFKVRVHTEVPADWAGFGGAEAGALAGALDAAVAPLDHRLLNELVDEPDDERLARHIASRLALPAAPALGLWSNDTTGVELDEQGRAMVWRRFRFQSAHRLPNVPLGHKCGRMHGHGFEAVLHVSIQPGESAAAAAERVDGHWAPIHMALNYACLNEIEGLDNPTSEMLSRWLWQRLSGELPGLRSIQVYETASCGAQYDGAAHRIWKDFHLDCAVRLKRAPASSPLAGLHGHTYTLRLHLSAPLDELRGWAVDFGDVKERFRPVFKALDHHALHDIPDLADADSASLARWALQRAREQLPQTCRVDVFETEGCGATAVVSGAPLAPVV